MRAAAKLRHFQRLLVMGDHVAHEGCVTRGVARVGNFDRFLRAQQSRRLARCAGLDNRVIGVSREH